MRVRENPAWNDSVRYPVRIRFAIRTWWRGRTINNRCSGQNGHPDLLGAQRKEYVR